MLAVEAVRGSATVVLEKSELSVAGNDGALVIEGNGGLRIPPNRTVTDVVLKDGAFLHVGLGSAVIRFGGRLRVSDCRHATVIAPPGGSYEYAGLHKAGRSQPLGPEALTGATLRGVLINDDATGRQYLQELREAAVVEPNVDGLRVRKAAWRLPFARRRLTRTTSMMRAVDDASFFAQELAGLVDNKCGAGSIRTKANWAAYRGRHLTAQSGWERFALGLFRLVGYGQRPGPPASLWLVLALLLTLPSLALTGQLPNGPISSTILTAEAFEQFVSLLLSPLFLLRLAGDPQLAVVTDISTLILLLVRATVAAPFVFFVVAMARFLRAEWPW